MNHKNFTKIALAMPLLMTVMVVQAAPADASWGHRGHEDHWHSSRHHHPYGHRVHSLPRRSNSLSIGNGGFYYEEGRFYRRHVRDYVVVPAPIGAVVYSLPGGCRTVVVGGVSYYNYEDVYYHPVAGGYRVVNMPVEESQVVAVPSEKPQDSFTVNIPNGHSGYTTVILKRSGQGYVGPQGEFYPEFPKIEQLRAMYAK